ncbi:MAG: amidohydrolase [Lachnospiraceae bacterium]|jgi:predicted amidohydrolase YtcJ|nr:amidohydrolase [Lachnospiraceae bacterium]
MLDVVLYNGSVYSMENGQVYEAIGVEGDEVRFLGSDEEAARLPAGQRIDLQGCAVLPGFNEGHMHLASYAFTYCNAPLFDCRSVEECQEAVRLYLRKHPEASWVYARGWNEDYFMAKRYPTRADLDAISTEIPILMVRVCGHLGVCNSAAFERIRALREAQEWQEQMQEESGLLYEGACELFYRILPKPTQAYVEELLLAGMKALNRCGITTCQTDDFVAIPGADWRQMIEAYQSLEAKGQMTVRVYEQCIFENLTGLQAFLQAGYRTGQGGEYFRIGPLKLIQDGSLGAKTALLSRPYKGSKDEYGLAVFTQQELNALIDTAHEAGMQIAVHCIGDRAMQMTLDALERAQKRMPRSDCRHGLVHVQISSREILERMSRDGVIAYIQPVFIEYDMDMAAARVQEAQQECIYAWKSMEELGILTVGGSDAPIESFDVLNNLYYAVTREKLAGGPKGGWKPEQKVTVPEAVAMFTTHAAKACFQEERIGRLLPGMKADLVVLSQDPFTTEPHALPKIQVEATMTGGRVVYQKEKR